MLGDNPHLRGFAARFPGGGLAGSTGIWPFPQTSNSVNPERFAVACVRTTRTR